MNEVKNILALDLNERVCRLYAALGAHKYILLSVFVLSLFTYTIFITQMMPDNHASRFPWLIPGGIGSGRWMSIWIGHLQYNADLPVFLPVASILMGIAASALIVRRWALPLTPLSVFLTLSALMTYPAHLASFYYTFMVTVFFASFLFAALAFYVCDRFSIRGILLSSLFVLMMMATYQLSLSVVITLAVLAAITDLMKRPNLPGLRDAFMTALARAIAVVIGGLAYRISAAVLGITPPRSITYTSLQEIPLKVLEIVRATIEQLGATQPELLLPIKLVLNTILVVAVLISLFRVRRSPLAIAAMVAFWAFSLFAVKAVFLVVTPDGSMWEYRYNLATGILYVFALAVLLSAFPQSLLRTAAQMVAAFVVVSFVQADLLRQGVLLRGQQHDLALANRVLDRIETLPNIDYSKTYDLIRVGRYSDYRLNLMRLRGHENAFYRLGDTHMDIGEISDRWVDEEVFRMLGSKIEFVYDSTDPEFSAKIQRVQAELLEGRRPWPAPESVFINGDEIIVFMRRE